MRRPPADDIAGHAVLRQDIPQGLGRARQIGHRTHALPIGVGLGKTVNAVIKRPFARGNRCPEHGGQLWVERAEIAHDAPLYQLLQIGHFPGIHQRIDYLPVCRVPADKQYFFVSAVSHCAASIP